MPPGVIWVVIGIGIPIAVLAWFVMIAGVTQLVCGVVERISEVRHKLNYNRR